MSMSNDPMVRERRYKSRATGQPTGNKHKAHRAQLSSKKCAAYESRGQRERNRDRRMARIARGFRTFETHAHPEPRHAHKHEASVRNGEAIKTCTIERTFKNTMGKQTHEVASVHHGFGSGPTAIPAKMSKRNPTFCFNHHRWEAAA